jgi:hypothetical protein
MIRSKPFQHPGSDGRGGKKHGHAGKAGMASKRHRKRRLGNELSELRNVDRSLSRVETATPAKPAWPPGGIASDASATNYLSFGTEIGR